MSMTHKQVESRLKAISSAANSLHGDGYSKPTVPVPSEACWDIRFLLEHIHYLKAELSASKNCLLCDDHQWPYGYDIDGDNRPVCVWCEALRADALEKKLIDTLKQISEARTLLANSTPNAKLIPLENQQVEWSERFGKWWAETTQI